MKRLFLGLIALATLAGCGKKDSGVTAEDVKQETAEAFQAAQDFTVEQMESYQNDAAARIDSLGGRIEELGARAESSAAYTKAEVRENISELREKRTAAQLKLDELKGATGQAWRDIRAGVDAALQDLENSYSTAASRFSK